LIEELRWKLILFVLIPAFWSSGFQSTRGGGRHSVEVLMTIRLNR